MIGKINPKFPRVCVVGGGISGLLATYYLDRAGYVVEIHEAQSRWGGLIQTQHAAEGIYESAAHSVLLTDSVLELSNELGVKWVSVNKDSKTRWILRDGVLRQFPLKFQEILESIFRIFFVFGSLKTLTISDFAKRHLGKGFLDYLINPALAGIFAASPEQISLTALMPKLKTQKHKTLFFYLLFNRFQNKKNSKKNEKKYGMHTPLLGMESLIQALVKHLTIKMGDRMFLNSEINCIDDFKETTDEPINTVITIPADSAARFFTKDYLELSEGLKSIQYAPLVTVTVWAKNEDFTVLPNGVGFLVPEVESESKVLGILYNSSSFNDRVVDSSSISSFTVMFGGSRSPSWVSAGDTDIYEQVKSEFKKYLEWNGTELKFKITRWNKAIPVYNLNLENVWALANKTWCSESGNILFGNYTGQVSIRGMIESAKNQWSEPK